MLAVLLPLGVAQMFYFTFAVLFCNRHFGTARIVVQSRVCEPCGPLRPAGLLLLARRAGVIDRLLHGWRSAAAAPKQRRANAGSTTLSADVGS